MPRGRTLKAKKRDAYWLSKVAEKGKLQAQVEDWKKKPLDLKLYEILKPAIDKIDPLELIAIVGGTIICHDVVLKGQEFAKALPELILRPTQTYWGFLLHSLGVPGAKQVAEGIGSTIEAGVSVATDAFKSSNLDDLTVWLISFGISYYVFRHGGSMLSVAKLFFGMAK